MKKNNAKSEIYTPYFGKEVLNHLPDLFRLLWEIYPDDERAFEVAVLSVFAAISGMFSKAKVLHSNEKVGINLYVNIISTASSNKSVMKKGLLVAQAIDDHVRSETDEKIKLNKFISEDPNFSEAEMGEITVPQLLVPANSSSAAFFDAIKVNNGRGLVYEPEMDTLVNVFKQNWGDFTTALRVNFHNEKWSQNRLKTGSVVIDNPCFSLLLSGTIEQAYKLYPNFENGTASRCIFLLYPHKRKWNRNALNNKSSLLIDEVNAKLAEHAVQIYRQYQDTDLTFRFRDSDAELANEMFEKIDEKYSSIEESWSIICRMGVIFSKIAATSTMIRHYQSGTPFEKNDDGEIYIDKDDAAFGRIIIKCLIQHSIVFLTNVQNVAKIISSKEVNKKELLDMLPSVFNRAELLIAAASLRIPARTADRYRSELCDDGKIRGTHNSYEKVIIPDPKDEDIQTLM